MKKMLKKRSGFTLVELLIVIIIIGILAGSMLLLLGSSSDKAEATKIVSDLRSMKAAALMYYADGGREPNIDGVTDTGLGKYMDRAMSGDFEFVEEPDDSGTWYVGKTGVSDTKVQEQLEKMADESGLLMNTTSADKYTTGAAVYMRAR